MTKGWQLKRLSDLYQIGSSKRVLKSQWKTEGVPFYRGREVTRLATEGFVENELFISEKHFAELSKEYGVPKTGDIIITAIGTIGNSHVVRGSDRFYFKDASVLWMKRTAEVSSEFVNLWLKSPSFFDQLDRGNGATVDTLTIKKLQSAEIVVPPLAEQQRIVDLLDEAFDGLATAKANAEKNLQNARTLFESHLQSVFTQRGPGWVEKTIGDICDIRGGGTPSKAVERYWKGKIPWVSPKDMKFEVVSDSIDHISVEAIEGSATSLIPKGAVLMVVRSGILARIVPLAVTGRELTINQDLKALCPKSTVESRFLYSLLESKMPELLSLVSRGATVHRLQTEQIRALNCYLPPKVEQLRIIEKIDSMREETQHLESLYQRKLAALDDLKKSLLHQAFNGALRHGASLPGPISLPST